MAGGLFTLGLVSHKDKTHSQQGQARNSDLEQGYHLDHSLSLRLLLLSNFTTSTTANEENNFYITLIDKLRARVPQLLLNSSLVKFSKPQRGP